VLGMTVSPISELLFALLQLLFCQGKGSFHFVIVLFQFRLQSQRNDNQKQWQWALSFDSSSGW